MNENQGGSNNLLDTTDCLEAVGVFKGWKNLLFIIIIICLLLLQLSFWLINTGCVSVPKKKVTIGEFRMRMQPVKAEFKQNMAQDANEAEEETAAEPEQAAEQEEPEETDEPAVAAEESAEPEEAAEPEQATEPEKSVVPKQPAVAAEPEKTSEPVPVTMRVEITDSEQSDQKAPEVVTSEIPVTAEVGETKSFLFGITFGHLVWLIRFLNAVLILGTTLYCMTMLFSLKVSMLGRLGGINHITRAFFLSLLALILLLPWHEVFNGVALGAMFTSNEIVEWYSARTGDLFDTILYYLRFCAFWLLIVLLLVLAQIRSSRWAAAILRRLEVI